MLSRFYGRIGRAQAILIAVMALLAYAMLAPWTVFGDDTLGVVSGDLTPAEVLTLGGASIVNSILMGVLIKAWNPSEAAKDRFGPLLALLVGIVIVVGFAILQPPSDLVSAFLTGIIVGGGSMGVHDTVNSFDTPPGDFKPLGG